MGTGWTEYEESRLSSTTLPIYTARNDNVTYLIPAISGAMRQTFQAGLVPARRVGALLAFRLPVREALAAEPAHGLLEHDIDPALLLLAH